MNPILVILIAIIPAVALLIFIYFQDSHEKEPLSLLLSIFGLGILSAIPAIILEWAGEKMLELTFGGLNQIVYLAIYAFFGVGLIEEGVKFLAAYILTWRNKHFNYKFDGIVYCLFASMGFAAIENVMYLIIENFTSSNSNAALTMGIQRGLLAIPAHAMCAIFMGYFYGNAKYFKSFGDRARCRSNMWIGFLIAVSLHSFYDFCLFTQNGFFYGLFVIFVIVADVFTVIRIIKAKKEDQKMYETPLYRQYWTGPAANPYQAYGGYQAPEYGRYSYNPQGGQGVQPQQVAQQQAYVPQQVSQMAYTPQQVGQQQAYMPQQTNTQQPYAPQQTNQDTSRFMPQQQTSSQTEQTVQALDYIPEAYKGSTSVVTNTGVAPKITRKQLLHCPVCGTINSLYAFYCTSCGASIHQMKNKMNQ